MRALNKSAVFFASFVVFIFMVLPFCEAEVISVNSGMQNIQVYDAKRLAVNQAEIVKTALQPAPAPVVTVQASAEVKAVSSAPVSPVSRMAALNAMSFVQAPLDPVTKRNMQAAGIPPPSPVPIVLVPPVPVPPVPPVYVMTVPEVKQFAEEVVRMLPAKEEYDSEAKSAPRSAIIGVLNDEQSVFKSPASLSNIDESDQCVMPGIPGAEVSSAGFDSFGAGSAMASADKGIAEGSMNPGAGSVVGSRSGIGEGSSIGGPTEGLFCGRTGCRPDRGGGGDDNSPGAAWANAKARGDYLDMIGAWATETYQQGTAIASIFEQMMGDPETVDGLGSSAGEFGSPVYWNTIGLGLESAFNGLQDTIDLYKQGMDTFTKLTNAVQDKSGHGAGSMIYNYYGLLGTCKGADDCKSAETFYYGKAKAASDVERLKQDLQKPGLTDKEKLDLEKKLTVAENAFSQAQGFDQTAVNKYASLTNQYNSANEKLKKIATPEVTQLLSQKKYLEKMYGTSGEIKEKIHSLESKRDALPPEETRAKKEFQDQIDAHKESGEELESIEGKLKASLQGEDIDKLSKELSRIQSELNKLSEDNPTKEGMSLENQGKAQTWLNNKAQEFGLQTAEDAEFYMGMKAFDDKLEDLIGTPGKTSLGPSTPESQGQPSIVDYPATGTYKSLADLKKTFEALKNVLDPELKKQVEKEIKDYEKRLGDGNPDTPAEKGSLEKDMEDLKKMEEDAQKSVEPNGKTFSDKEKKAIKEKQREINEKTQDLIADIAKTFKEIITGATKGMNEKLAALEKKIVAAFGEIPSAPCSKPIKPPPCGGCPEGLYGKDLADFEHAMGQATSGAPPPGQSPPPSPPGTAPTPSAPPQGPMPGGETVPTPAPTPAPSPQAPAPTPSPSVPTPPAGYGSGSSGPGFPGLPPPTPMGTGKFFISGLFSLALNQITGTITGFGSAASTGRGEGGVPTPWPSGGSAGQGGNPNVPGGTGGSGSSGGGGGGGAGTGSAGPSVSGSGSTAECITSPKCFTFPEPAGGGAGGGRDRRKQKTGQTPGLEGGGEARPGEGVAGPTGEKGIEGPPGAPTGEPAPGKGEVIIPATDPKVPVPDPVPAAGAAVAVAQSSLESSVTKAAAARGLTPVPGQPGVYQDKTGSKYAVDAEGTGFVAVTGSGASANNQAKTDLTTARTGVQDSTASGDPAAVQAAQTNLNTAQSNYDKTVAFPFSSSERDEIQFNNLNVVDKTLSSVKTNIEQTYPNPNDMPPEVREMYFQTLNEKLKLKLKQIEDKYKDHHAFTRYAKMQEAYEELIDKNSKEGKEIADINKQISDLTTDILEDLQEYPDLVANALKEANAIADEYKGRIATAQSKYNTHKAAYEQASRLQGIDIAQIGSMAGQSAWQKAVFAAQTGGEFLPAELASLGASSEVVSRLEKMNAAQKEIKAAAAEGNAKLEPLHKKVNDAKNKINKAKDDVLSKLSDMAKKKMNAPGLKEHLVDKDGKLTDKGKQFKELKAAEKAAFEDLFNKDAGLAMKNLLASVSPSGGTFAAGPAVSLGNINFPVGFSSGGDLKTVDLSKFAFGESTKALAAARAASNIKLAVIASAGSFKEIAKLMEVKGNKFNGLVSTKNRLAALKENEEAILEAIRSGRFHGKKGETQSLASKPKASSPSAPAQQSAPQGSSAPGTPQLAATSKATAALITGAASGGEGGIWSDRVAREKKQTQDNYGAALNFKAAVDRDIADTDKKIIDLVSDINREVAQSGFGGYRQNALLWLAGQISNKDYFKSLKDAEQEIGKIASNQRKVWEDLVDERTAQINAVIADMNKKLAAADCDADCQTKVKKEAGEKFKKIHDDYDPAIAQAEKAFMDAINNADPELKAALDEIKGLRAEAEQKIIKDEQKRLQKELAIANGDYFAAMDEDEAKGLKSLSLWTELGFEKWDRKGKEYSKKLAEEMKQGVNMLDKIRGELAKRGFNLGDLLKDSSWEKVEFNSDADAVKEWMNNVNDKLGLKGSDRIDVAQMCSQCSEEQLRNLGMYWDTFGNTLAKQVAGTYTDADTARGFYITGILKKNNGDLSGAQRDLGAAVAIYGQGFTGEKARAALNSVSQDLAGQMISRTLIDVAADPLNFLTFGTLAAGKVFQAVNSGAKLLKGLSKASTAGKAASAALKAGKALGTIVGKGASIIKSVPGVSEIAGLAKKVTGALAGAGAKAGDFLKGGTARKFGKTVGELEDAASGLKKQLAAANAAGDTKKAGQLAGQIEDTKKVIEAAKAAGKESGFWTKQRSLFTAPARDAVADLGRKAEDAAKKAANAIKNSPPGQAKGAIKAAVEAADNFDAGKSARDALKFRPKSPVWEFLTGEGSFFPSAAPKGARASALNAGRNLETALTDFRRAVNSGHDVGGSFRNLQNSMGSFQNHRKVMDAGEYMAVSRFMNNLPFGMGRPVQGVRNGVTNLGNRFSDFSSGLRGIPTAGIQNARRQVSYAENALDGALRTGDTTNIVRAWDFLENANNARRQATDMAHAARQAGKVVSAAEQAPPVVRPSPVVRAPENPAGSLQRTLDTTPPENVARRMSSAEDEARALESRLDASRARMDRAVDDFKEGRIDMDEFARIGAEYADAEAAARNAKSRASQLKEMAERRAAGAPAVEPVPRPAVEVPVPRVREVKVPAGRMTPEQAKAKLFDDVGIKEEKFTQYRVRTEDGAYKPITKEELPAKYGPDWESKVSELSAGDAPQIRTYEQVRYKKGNVWISEDEAMSEVVNKIRTQQLDNLGKTNQRMVDLQASKSKYYEAIEDGDISEAKGMEEINKLDARISELKGEFDKTAKGLTPDEVDKLYEGQETYLAYLRNKIKGASESERKILNEDYRRISAQQDALFELKSRQPVTAPAKAIPAPSLVPKPVQKLEDRILEGVKQDKNLLTKQGAQADVYVIDVDGKKNLVKKSKPDMYLSGPIKYTPDEADKFSQVAALQEAARMKDVEGIPNIPKLSQVVIKDIKTGQVEVLSDIGGIERKLADMSKADVGSDLFKNKEVYLVTDLVEGKGKMGAAMTLDEYLKIPGNKIRRAAYQDLIKTVDQMHSKGIAHTDIHAGNVLVDSEGNLHLIDFGYAKNKNELGADFDVAVDVDKGRLDLWVNKQIIEANAWEVPVPRVAQIKASAAGSLENKIIGITKTDKKLGEGIHGETYLADLGSEGKAVIKTPTINTLERQQRIVAEALLTKKAEGVPNVPKLQKLIIKDTQTGSIEVIADVGGLERKLSELTNAQTGSLAAKNKEVYMVTDLVDGAGNRGVALSLEEYLRVPGNKVRKEAYDSLMRSVNELHERGIVHVDLNAKNVLVDKNGNLHIIDFGLGRTETELGAKFEKFKSDELATINRQIKSAIDNSNAWEIPAPVKGVRERVTPVSKIEIEQSKNLPVPLKHDKDIDRIMPNNLLEELGQRGLYDDFVKNLRSQKAEFFAGPEVLDKQLDDAARAMSKYLGDNGITPPALFDDMVKKSIEASVGGIPWTSEGARAFNDNFARAVARTREDRMIANWIGAGEWADGIPSETAMQGVFEKMRFGKHSEYKQQFMDSLPAMGYSPEEIKKFEGAFDRIGYFVDKSDEVDTLAKGRNAVKLSGNKAVEQIADLQYNEKMKEIRGIAEQYGGGPTPVQKAINRITEALQPKPVVKEVPPRPVVKPVSPAAEKNFKKLGSKDFGNALSEESLSGNAGVNRAAVNAQIDRKTGEIVEFTNYPKEDPSLKEITFEIDFRTGKIVGVYEQRGTMPFNLNKDLPPSARNSVLDAVDKYNAKMPSTLEVPSAKPPAVPRTRAQLNDELTNAQAEWRRVYDEYKHNPTDAARDANHAAANKVQGLKDELKALPPEPAKPIAQQAKEYPAKIRQSAEASLPVKQPPKLSAQDTVQIQAKAKMNRNFDNAENELVKAYEQYGDAGSDGYQKAAAKYVDDLNKQKAEVDLHLKKYPKDNEAIALQDKINSNIQQYSPEPVVEAPAVPAQRVSVVPTLQELTKLKKDIASLQAGTGQLKANNRVLSVKKFNVDDSTGNVVLEFNDGAYLAKPKIELSYQEMNDLMEKGIFPDALKHKEMISKIDNKEISMRVMSSVRGFREEQGWKPLGSWKGKTIPNAESTYPFTGHMFDEKLPSKYVLEHGSAAEWAQKMGQKGDFGPDDKIVIATVKHGSDVLGRTGSTGTSVAFVVSDAADYDYLVNVFKNDPAAAQDLMVSMINKYMPVSRTDTGIDSFLKQMKGKTAVEIELAGLK